MKSYIKKCVCFIFVIGSLVLSSSCSKENSVSENTINNIKQTKNGTQSEINTPTVEEQLSIHIKNSKGYIDINNSQFADELIKIVENPDKIVKTGISCPFDNKVTISKNQKILKEFFIAADGCNVLKRADESIIEIGKTLYEKLEQALQDSNNSLNVIKRK